MKQQENFYKSDSLWSVYGLNSKEEFYRKINLSPKFHQGVPEDLSNEFKTIEYLIVLSYHHAGFLDEAVTKALVAIEIAIKIKAKQLEISLEIKNKKTGKKRDKSLFALTTEVLNRIELTSLQSEFNRTRNMRNRRVHKDTHTFMGVVGYPINNIRLIINLINHLFIEESEIKDIIEKENKYKSLLLNFQHKPMVLEFEGKRILIESIPIFKYIKFKNTELLVLVIEPVINNVYESITENPLRKPLILTLKDFIIDDVLIKGNGLKENPVSISFTDKVENIYMFNTFIQEKQKVDQTNLFVYNEAINRDAPWEIENIIFEYCWN